MKKLKPNNNRLTCAGCRTPIAEPDSDGKLVIVSRHHGEKHETRINIADLLRRQPERAGENQRRLAAQTV